MRLCRNREQKIECELSSEDVKAPPSGPGVPGEAGLCLRKGRRRKRRRRSKQRVRCSFHLAMKACLAASMANSETLACVALRG